MHRAEVERSRSRGGRIEVVSRVEGVPVVKRMGLSWGLVNERASEEGKDEKSGEQGPYPGWRREGLVMET